MVAKRSSLRDYNDKYGVEGPLLGLTELNPNRSSNFNRNTAQVTNSDLGLSSPY